MLTQKYVVFDGDHSETYFLILRVPIMKKNPIVFS